MNNFKISPDINNNNIFLLNHSEIEGRLDPIFYNSNTKKFIKGKYPVSTIRNISLFIKSGVGAGKQDQANELNGIVQIRPTNITNDGFLKYDKNIYLPKDSFADKIKENDVLFNNTNSQELVGKTAIAKNISGYFYSNHITKIIVNNEIIRPEYLWILLNAYQKNKIFYSICTNWNNQSGVGTELLKSLKIPLPTKEKQEEIINIYEIAYQTKKQKEAESESLLISIDDYLLNELGITLPESDNSLNNRMFKVDFSQVTYNRWNPEYHQTHFSKCYNSMSKIYDLIDLSKLSLGVFQGVGRNLTDKDTYKLLKVKNIKRHNEIDYEDIEFVESVPKFKLLKKYDIISPFIGEAIRQIKFSNFNKEEGNWTVDNNTGVIRINFDIVNPEFICQVLNSKIGKIQIQQLIGGGGVPFLGAFNVKKIKIPLPPLEIQNEIAEHIKSIRKLAKQLKVETLEVLEQANKKIEKMILGE